MPWESLMVHYSFPAVESPKWLEQTKTRNYLHNEDVNAHSSDWSSFSDFCGHASGCIVSCHSCLHCTRNMFHTAVKGHWSQLDCASRLERVFTSLGFTSSRGRSDARTHAIRLILCEFLDVAFGLHQYCTAYKKSRRPYLHCCCSLRKEDLQSSNCSLQTPLLQSTNFKIFWVWRNSKGSIQRRKEHIRTQKEPQKWSSVSPLGIGNYA